MEPTKVISSKQVLDVSVTKKRLANEQRKERRKIVSILGHLGNN
jgi:hypothetical protein